jgi:acetyltransferase
MMEQTRIYKALGGVRGRKAVDLPALEEFLVRFSQLVIEQSWINEIDINPLLAGPGGLLALDARVIAHPAESGACSRPAIRPYPRQYVAPWTARDGTALVIRPIRPEDEPLLIEFHQALSDRTVALRYFHAIKLSQRVAHERLMRICFIDYDREMALVAEHKDSSTGVCAVLGVARLGKLHGANEAEFALVIVDHFQGMGLGTEFLRRLIAVGRDLAFDRISGEILPENRGMQRICAKLGFHLNYEPGDMVVKAVLDLA